MEILVAICIKWYQV